MSEGIILRSLQKEDCHKIAEAFEKQGWKDKTITQFQNYLALQKSGSRDIVLAEIGSEFAGYLAINWSSDYMPFREREIPEVVDYNVLKKH